MQHLSDSSQWGIVMPKVFFNADIIEMLLTHMKNINVIYGGNMGQLALVMGNKTEAKAKNIDNLVEAMGLFSRGEEKESSLRHRRGPSEATGASGE